MTEPGFRLADQELDPAIPLDRVCEHPDNPNRGDMGVIEESMTEWGFYGGIVVHRDPHTHDDGTEHDGRIIVGNHRNREARFQGATHLPGFWLNVDEDAARGIMAVDNESTRRGKADMASLVALLQPLQDGPHGLRGSGYDEAKLAALIERLKPPSAFPEYDGDTIETEHTCPKCGYQWSGTA